MRVFVFLASFSYEFTELFFLMKVLFFLASGILEDGSWPFSYEFISFFAKNCFFNESVGFFGFRHLEDGSVAFFLYVFISFFSNRIVFF